MDRDSYMKNQSCHPTRVVISSEDPELLSVFVNTKTVLKGHSIFALSRMQSATKQEIIISNLYSSAID